MRIYKNEKGESNNSFLDLIRDQYTIDDIDLVSLYQFIKYGALYFEKTFIKGVSKQFSHQELNLDPKFGLKKEEIQDSRISKKYINKPDVLFLKFFEERVSFLKDKRISVDLTGGIDSRLIVATLDFYGIDFDVFYSLDVGNEHEFQIVKEVANLLGKDLLVKTKSDEILDVDFLYELCDGSWDLLYINSLVKNQSFRKENNYDLIVTGVGGELYKDFWWLHDFPFYNKRRFTLQKLIKYRMYPIDWIHQIWNNDKYPIEKLNKDFTNRLTEYARGTNTETYDNIYYNVRIKEMVSVLSNTTSKFLQTYSPLIEPDLVEIGFNLNRRDRFYNFFHRKIISQLNSDLAKIPTTEGGVTIHDSPIYLLRDFGYYVFDKLKKVKKKLIVDKSKIENQYSANEKFNTLISRSIEQLCQHGVLKENINASDLPISVMGRFLTVAKLLENLRD